MVTQHVVSDWLLRGLAPCSRTQEISGAPQPLDGLRRSEVAGEPRDAPTGLTASSTPGWLSQQSQMAYRARRFPEGSKRPSPLSARACPDVPRMGSGTPGGPGTQVNARVLQESQLFPRQGPQTTRNTEMQQGKQASKQACVRSRIPPICAERPP